MNKINWIALLFISTSLLPIGSGLRYLFDGRVYENSDLRNYTVVGQIILGLLTMAYGYWQYKTSLKKVEQ